MNKGILLYGVILASLTRDLPLLPVASGKIGKSAVVKQWRKANKRAKSARRKNR